MEGIADRRDRIDFCIYVQYCSIESPVLIKLTSASASHSGCYTVMGWIPWEVNQGLRLISMRDLISSV